MKMVQESSFDDVFLSLEEILASAVKDSELGSPEIEEVTESFVSSLSIEFLEILKKNSDSMNLRERKNTLAFENRNYKRWNRALDYLTMIWVSAQEVSEDTSKRGPLESDPIVFDTLAHLQPRALLLCSEIICLIRGGFADGALARWRSLHEIVVTMIFIAKHGQQCALHYRYSLTFAEARAARQYNEHAVRAGLTPLSPEDISELEFAAKDAEKLLGRSLKKDWDWSQDHLSGKPATFASIEADVEMDHWRPRYKWASRHIHSGFIRPNTLLGQSEATESFHQVGASNSGMVDPIHMAAISLMQATTTFVLFSSKDLRGVVFARILDLMSEEIGPLAQKIEEETLLRARRSRKRNR